MNENNKQTDSHSPEIPASTVLLLRDGAEGLEVFMVVRHHKIDSFSGALVFPGGKVDPGDGAARPYCTGGEDLDDAELPYRVAAIREAFEECGVLLAYDGAGEILHAARLEKLEARWRDRLMKDQATIGEMCAEEDLRLAVDRLVFFAHWITPRIVPKVFDTHFFLAAAPSDQVALHDGEESTDSTWITPANALAEAEAGRRTVVFPTRMNLGKLDNSQNLDDAMKAAASAPVVTVQPIVEMHEEGRLMRIPAEAGYAGSLFLARHSGDALQSIEKLE
jgi:8-oxo-dGTP pyrophosphatase MutT (NUDIX family)